MTMRYPIFWLLFLTAFRGGAFGQTADAVFGASVRAHGEAALAAATSVVLTGTSTSGATREPVTISASLDGKVRIDYGRPVTRSIVTTPQGRFEITAGKLVHRPPHAGQFAQLDVLAVLGIRHLAAAGVERTALGSGQTGGRATTRARAVTSRQQTHYGRVVKDDAEIDFDQQTGLIAAIRRRQYADESLDLAFFSTYTFSDYRAVSGLLLPFRIDRYLDNQLKQTIILDSIQLNPVLAADLFER